MTAGAVRIMACATGKAAATITMGAAGVAAGLVSTIGGGQKRAQQGEQKVTQGSHERFRSDSVSCRSSWLRNALTVAPVLNIYRKQNKKTQA